MTRTFTALGIAVACAFLSASAQAQDPIPGIGPAGPIVKVHTGLRFTEGPASDAKGDVYFTDVPASNILKAKSDSEAEVFLSDSQGANGMMFGADGTLFVCQGNEGRVIAISPADKQIRPIAAEYEGKRFIRPNDLVVDRAGGVYFTDPKFGGGMAPQDKAAVYYVSPDGKVTRLIDDLVAPNGVILSPDQKTLYVVPSGTPDVMAYTVKSPGQITDKRVLCQLAQAEGQPPRGGDGLAVDSNGNLYLAVPTMQSIQVVSPDGKTLGMIKIPEGPSNCTFGGPDFKTLHVTARQSLYAVPMEVVGYPGPFAAK